MMCRRKELEFYSMPPAAMLSFYTTIHICSESVIKWVAWSTAALHIQISKLALLLFHMHPDRFALH